MTSDIETNWFKKGISLEDAGQLAQARVAFSYAFQHSPTVGRGLSYAALLIQLRDRATAEHVLEQLGETFENKLNHHYMHLRGRLERSRHNYDRASDWYRQIELPEETFPLILLGSCLARQGRFEAAIETLAKATKLPFEDGVTQPDEAWVNIALIERARGNFNDAMHAAERALEFDSNYSDAKEIIADVSGAITFSSQALDAGSHEPCLHELYEAGLFAQAFTVAQKRVALEPDWIQAQTKIGTLLIEFRRFTEAEKHIQWLESDKYRQLLADSLDEDEIQHDGSAADQTRNVALELRAYLEKTRGNLGIATRLLERLVHRLPRHFHHAIELIDCLCLQERYDEALEECAEIQNQTRNRNYRGSAEEDALMKTGLIYRVKQDYLTAAAFWKQGAERFPNNPRFPKLVEDATAASQLQRKLFGCVHPQG